MRPGLTLRLAAVLLTALALVPPGAHLMALPNKIGLPQSGYFVVQGIYEGWWLGGLFWVAALLADLALALALRRAGAPWRAAAAAVALLALAFALFFAATDPANRATENWTFVPEDWEALRARWEWSHAANALVIFAALACAARAAIAAWPPGAAGPGAGRG